MFLGYRLKELRKDKEMSQAQLGEILGVSKVSVSGYENGTRVPSVEILLMMLDVFKVSADYLLGRELNVICEDDLNLPVCLSLGDIEIIRELRSKPSLYNDTNTFFTAFDNPSSKVKRSFV